MKPRILVSSVILVLFHVVSVIPNFSQTKSVQRAITNQDVVEMVQAKLLPETIIKVIQQAPAVDFDTTPQALIALKKASVDERVIEAMLSKAGIAGTLPSSSENEARKTKEGPEGNDDKTIIINGGADAIRSVIIQELTGDGYTLQKSETEQLVFDKRMSGSKGIGSAIFSKLGGNKLEPMMTSLTFLITRQSNKSYLIYGSIATRRIDEARAPSNVNTKEARQLIRKYLQKIKSGVENR